MSDGPKIKVIARNKKAFFDFHIYNRYEAGMTLKGSEIKSIRNGGVNLADGYVRIQGGEVYLVQARIAPYKQGGEHYNHDPLRDRKLLLKRREIDSIIGRVQRRGLTILPLELYLKGNLAKLEIGLAKSKKKYDKRLDIIKKEQERETDREFKERSRSDRALGE